MSRLKKDNSPNLRVLQVKPSPEYIRWLAARMSEERAFIRYHSAGALLAAVRDLDSTRYTAIGEAIAAAKQALGTGKDAIDQLKVLEDADKELQRKMSEAFPRGLSQ